jgi:esterase/lipase
MEQNKKSSTFLMRFVKLFGGIVLVVLVSVLVIGLIPVPKEELPSHSNPIDDYENATAQINAILDAEKGVVREVCYSRFMTHGQKTERVYVLIHGMTNSPRQFVELGELLYAQGHNVFIPLVPHHGLIGADVGALKNINPEEMSAFADQILDLSAGLGEEVHVIGLSVGGTIASWSAQNRPEVTRVMLMAPMFGIGRIPNFLDFYAINIFTRIPNINFIGPGEPVREHVYRGQSSRGVAEAMLYGATIFKQVNSTEPGVTEIIIVTNANDHTVDNDNTKMLADIWESWGSDITRYEFPAELGLPHSLVDISEPGTDIDFVNTTILTLLGEQ